VSLLEIEHLAIRFGGLVAVADFGLQMEEGELVGLIGPNGSGKTTVFNMISGFYTPTEGTIRFDGRDITGLRPDAVARLGLARIFQANRLFRKQTVLDNIMAAHHLRLKSGWLAAVMRMPAYVTEEKRVREQSMHLLDLLALADVAGEPAGSLPHGSQRKLEVARALATEPKLLLLDEPATGMSLEEIDDLMEFTLKIREDFDLTILLVEHTMRVVMGICPRIIVIDSGKTIARGTPEEIQNNQEVIRAYLGADEDA